MRLTFAHARRRSLLHCLLAIVMSGMLLVGCNQAVPGDAATLAARQAEQLYRQAWHMVLEEYVDPTFNGQDWYRWKDRYNGKLRTEADAHVAIETMLASLNDEYTRFLKPRDMREQTMNIDSRLFGVGIQISMREAKLVVMSTIEDTPAAGAGLKPRDLITHINGEETSGLSVEEAADRIRGPEGTKVRLRIRRIDEKTGEAQVLEREIERAEIRIKSVFTKDLKNRNIGYVRLSSFISETTLPEMQEKLLAMKNKKALILDLRGNYGGLLSNAVDVADMFLDEGDIVSIVDRKKSRRVYSAKPGQVLGDDKPLVVLIDGGSASASEILSGALKDHQRAVLIGENTFGKGLVQKINPMYDGSGINITISKYLTPKGRDINKKGISPSIEVDYTEEDLVQHRDPQLEEAVEYLERTLLMAQGG